MERSEETNRVVARIRKMLDIKEGTATPGEIENAMALASKLMQDHQLLEADIQASENPPPDQPMGTADAASGGTNWATWESELVRAVSDLVGTVQYYLAHGVKTVEGAFNTERVGKGYRFYGPEEDCSIAAELFADLRHTIATLAIGKFGGVYKGDGAMYAMGFAQALKARAAKANQERDATVTNSTRTMAMRGVAALAGASKGALVHTPQAAAGSLGMVVAQKRDLASKWLADVRGVKLSRTNGGGGYSAGSASALSQGQTDGARTAFGVNRTKKLN